MKTFKICKSNKDPCKEQSAGATKQKRDTRSVCVKIPGELYERLIAIKEAGGYKSVYEIMQLITVCFIRHVDKARQRKEPSRQIPDDPISAEIEEMFTDFSYSEEQPEEGNKPKTHKTKKSTLYA